MDPVSSASTLDVRHVDARGFAELLGQCRASHLRIYHLEVGSLDGIDSLRSLATLTLEWAPKVRTLDPVFEMAGLCELQIRDFARLRDLSGIEKLKGLRKLVLTGGVWRPLRLASLRPVAAIHDLEALTLLNVRLEDDDITCLAGLRRLVSLNLSNQFDRAQVAILARHLNARLSTPLAASAPVQLACPACGAPKHLFTGRRMPFLCPTCDRGRFERLTREFQELVGA